MFTKLIVLASLIVNVATAYLRGSDHVPYVTKYNVANHNHNHNHNHNLYVTKHNIADYSLYVTKQSTANKPIYNTTHSAYSYYNDRHPESSNELYFAEYQ